MNSSSSSRLFEMLFRGIAANPPPPPPSSAQSEYITLLSNYIREQHHYHQNVERMLELLEPPTLNIDLTTLMQDISGGFAVRQQQQPRPLDLSANTSVYAYVQSNGEAAVCPITLEPFQEGETVRRITRCGHVFRDEALRSWFRRNNNCPVCRQTIS